MINSHNNNIYLKSNIHSITRYKFSSYVRQSTRISWDNVYTNYFQLLNGVKQGGVLSAKLFTLYIDGLFTELKQSGYECHINNTYMGALFMQMTLFYHALALEG